MAALKQHSDFLHNYNGALQNFKWHQQQAYKSTFKNLNEFTNFPFLETFPKLSKNLKLIYVNSVFT